MVLVTSNVSEFFIRNATSNLTSSFSSTYLFDSYLESEGTLELK